MEARLLSGKKFPLFEWLLINVNRQEKLEMSYDDPQAIRNLVYRYVEGLQWVMHYYYSGVASWGWFYDYHYAPRISGSFLVNRLLLTLTRTSRFVDLTGVDQMSFSFTLGQPFKPFEQLMGVLPVASMEHIPPAYRVCILNSGIPNC